MTDDDKMQTQTIRITDPDLVDLVPGYLDRRQRDLVTLREALGKADFPTLQTIGHQLRGNAGNFGLDGLSALGAELEAAAKACDAKGATEAVEKMEQFLRYTRVEVPQ